MKITKVEHIGVAVPSLKDAERLYHDILGLPVVDRETLADRKLNVVKVQAGETVLELLEAQPGEDVISKFIATRGAGIHHICFEVEDIEAATSELVAMGYSTLTPKPKLGAGHRLVNFLKPKETLGVLIELNQPAP
jgi:methylmalonyl-CoA/ethylmalonyl-CoA epimerase